MGGVGNECMFRYYVKIVTFCDTKYELISLHFQKDLLSPSAKPIILLHTQEYGTIERKVISIFIQNKPLFIFTSIIP